jgi:hypothetical protein
MSLNWNCKPMIERGIDIWCDRQNTGEREYLNPITEALVFSTMIVGCDGRKIDTFAKRIRQYEMACGFLVHQPRPEWRDKAIELNSIRADSFTEDGYISLAELKRHEGFTTNASSLTDAQWAKNLASLVADKASRDLRREA